MKCPLDIDVDLQMSDRQGIEIDYCPKCRGVWLDRGELDKIIERSGSTDQPRYENDQRGRDDYYSNREGRYSKDYRKKRGGFLGDLFDFD
jgi:Zn-finger nucleic acid-binding protein